MTFYGTTEHRETAEMTVRPGSSPKKGRDFDPFPLRPPHPAPCKGWGSVWTWATGTPPTISP